MFENTLTLTVTETAIITAIGMGTVFSVLILLTGILYLFRFIPKDQQTESNSNKKITVSLSRAPTQNTTMLVSVLPLHKAIIMATILDSLGIEQKKNQVRIKSIYKIS